MYLSSWESGHLFRVQAKRRASLSGPGPVAISNPLRPFASSQRARCLLSGANYTAASVMQARRAISGVAPVAAGSKESIHVASNRRRETIDVRVILAKMTRQRGRPVFTEEDQTFIVVRRESEENVAAIQEK